MVNRPACIEQDCDRPRHGHGRCLMHYKRQRTAQRRGPALTAGQRLLANVEVVDGCWEWTGPRDADGYGTLWVVVDGVQLQRAHRVAWAVANGPIPPGHFIRHRCDNPPCCNPEHLESGTAAENVGDMIARRRQARSGRLPQTKLTDDQVGAIRREYAVVRQGPRRCSNAVELAERYGVSADYVKHLVSGRGRKAGAA